MEKLTQSEIEKMLKMLKSTIEKEVALPSLGNFVEFQVVGESKKDLFGIKVYRGRIQKNKLNLGAQIKKNGIMLLELHINPTNVHINPDGEKIVGSHWHIYSEEYERRQAFPASDVFGNNFIDDTIAFLTEFNVVEKPHVSIQLELLS